MKFKAAVAVILAVSFMMAGCGKAETKKAKAEPEKVSETVTEEEESRPEGDFLKLPDEAIDDFNKLASELKSIFPDTKGKLMYGYMGEMLVPTEGGEKDCYLFDYYTYKKKIYTKIATVAMDKESSIVYLLEDDGTYSEAEAEAETEQEQKWCETSTPSLSADTAEDATEE